MEGPQVKTRKIELIFPVLILAVVIPVALSFVDPKFHVLAIMSTIGIATAAFGFRYVFGLLFKEMHHGKQ